MPLIIDANRSGDFSKPVSNHAGEVLKRIEAKKMRVTLGGRLMREHTRTHLRSLIVEWSRAGRVHRIEDRVVDSEESTVKEMAIKSDDPHVLALARVSGTRLVYTGDNNLIRDFKNVNFVNPKGKVVTPSTPEGVAFALFNNYGT